MRGEQFVAALAGERQQGIQFVAADDFGNIINPLIVEGQVHGGIAQGVGQALLEGVHYDPETGRDVPWDNVVRGFELDDEYVVVEDEELDQLAPEKSRDIDLRRFVPVEQLDPLFFERTYFLAPAGESTKAYRLLAATMEKTGRAGIATFVMRGKSSICQ